MMGIRKFLLAGLAAAPAVLGWTGSGLPADLGQPALPPVFTQTSPPSFSRFEVRGGFLVSTWGPETGEPNFNAEVILPKFYTLPGWQNYLIPRLQVGGVANLAGGTSYAYLGPIWTVNYNRYFGEIFFGGAVHDGQVNGDRFDPKRNKLGCRVLYHVGANAGYQIDAHWSAMLTFDHISDGAGTLSDCKVNQGATVLGVRIGYTF